MDGGLRIEMSSTALGFRLAGPHGSMILSELGSGALLLDFEGIAYSAFCDPMGAALEEVIERNGALTIFADASRMRSYETDFRRISAEWLQARRDAIRSCVVLVRSPLVQMWIDIVNVVTGGLVYAVDDHDLLRRLMREAIFEGARGLHATSPVERSPAP